MRLRVVFLDYFLDSTLNTIVRRFSLGMVLPFLFLCMHTVNLYPDGVDC
jgi:hypothetical protein